MKNNLSEFEKSLLDNMNKRAMLIIHIEETLKEIKVPMDKNVLYEMEEDELVGLFEMLLSAKENRKKYAKDETND